MEATQIIMGMPVTVTLDPDAPASLLSDVFDYFIEIDQRFSPYKSGSEISCFNRGDVPLSELSMDMLEILAIADETKRETKGYFEIRRPDGTIDPSGIVKGWAIRNAAYTIRGAGVANFCVNAGGDVQTGGKNPDGEDWSVGIQSPFKEDEIVKALCLSNRGIATSGTYVRGQHIYDPHRPAALIADIVSMTVIGRDVLEADRIATATFAMGKAGIHFVQELRDFEAYMIDVNGIATQTTGFGAYVIQ